MCFAWDDARQKCPFDAITIINLPTSLKKEVTHRFGPNTFKLHRLPMPRPGQVLGLVGTNGIGKSTALKILAGKLKPNLGRHDNPPDWTEILQYFRGSELQNFLTRILEDDIKAIIKPQYVDHVPKAVQGTVGEVIRQKDERGAAEDLIDKLDLRHLLDREVSQLSGGELQRFSICVMSVQKADMYMFDEPSSYLDVKQRLRAATVIRGLLDEHTYVVAVEHDLSILDYLSDFVCCLYGHAGAYGVVTLPFSVREGINNFMEGFIPTENMRFREEKLSFKLSDQSEGQSEGDKKLLRHEYPALEKTHGQFKLSVEAGEFTESEIITMLGENGTGKTTFIRLLAGLSKADNLEEGEMPEFNVSYKPQKIAPKFEGTVRMLLHKKIKDTFTSPQFASDVLKPLDIESLYDQEVKHLSGGELQRVALTVCLGTPADIYLIDEPSAYLDSEQRIHASKVTFMVCLSGRKESGLWGRSLLLALALFCLASICSLPSFCKY